MTSTTQLKPTLGTLHLWGIAVGLVISGEYFGWSYGWGAAGTLGLIATLLATTMYTCFIFSMLSLFKLRKTEPLLERTFRAPGYPIVPGIALLLALVCLVAMAWFNALIGLIFLGFMVVGFIYFQLTAKQRSDAPADAMLTGI